MKNKLLKLMFTAVLALLCACCISACGDAGGNPDGTPAGGQEQECKHPDSIHHILLMPTCANKGYECYECKDCGVRYGYDYVAPTGDHSYDNGTVLSSVDCTHVGVTLYTCINCGKTKTEEIKMVGGHSYYQPVTLVRPTCQNWGYQYVECMYCKEREYSKIEPLKHDWTEAVVIEPDCTHDGLHQRTCTQCKYTYNTVIPATGRHNYSDPTVVEPDCTHDGYEYKECSICGDKQYERFDAIGHEWDDGRIAFVPDCTHNGLKVFTCANCYETKSEILYATGEHDYVNGVCKYCNLDLAEVTDRLYNGSYGYEYFRTLQNAAGFCGLYDTIDESTKIFHHSETLNATETEDGYEFLTVDYTDFGLTYEEAIAVYKTYLDDKPLYYWLDKTLMVYGTNIILYADEKYAAATVRNAYNQNLYEKLEGYKDIAKGESAYSVALAYHDEIIKSIDYAYKSNGKPEDEAWAHNITGVFDGVGAVCEGYARSFQLLLNMRGIENILVTGFGGKAAHAWNLVKLDDGEWYWYDLTYDDTPNSYWGVSHKYAFATDEDFLKNHTVGSSDDFGVDFMPTLPSRADKAYSGNEILYRDEFTLDGLTYTVDGYDSVYLSYIDKSGDCVIPETVTYRGREFTVIGLAKFNATSTTAILPFGGTTIESLTIPASVLYIDDNALGYTGYVGMKNIYVDEDNPMFASLDGVLFTKNLYTMIVYPQANPRTSYAIPDETRCLAGSAFKSSEIALESLFLGKNLGNVGVVCWGGRYPEVDYRGGSIVIGMWRTILTAMSGNKELTISPENRHYSIRDGLLCNYSGTSVEAALYFTETVVIPQEVTYVEYNAFNKCENLKSVTFTTVLNYCKISFSESTALESVTFPEGWPLIYQYAFLKCYSLKNVNIPSTVTEIGAMAFSGCRSLTSITIPAGVNKIGLYPFEFCYSLSEIIVEEGNTAYKVVDNCLIEIATKTLICAYGNFTIPTDGSVAVIGTNAFVNCDEVSVIVIPEGVTEIDIYAFCDGEALSGVILPSSIEQIDYNYIEKRINVFYKGTASQWSSVKNYSNLGTLYFYSEERPTASGNYWHYVDGEPVIWQ